MFRVSSRFKFQVEHSNLTAVVIKIDVMPVLNKSNCCGKAVSQCFESIHSLNFRLGIQTKVHLQQLIKKNLNFFILLLVKVIESAKKNRAHFKKIKYFEVKVTIFLRTD